MKEAEIPRLRETLRRARPEFARRFVGAGHNFARRIVGQGTNPPFRRSDTQFPTSRNALSDKARLRETLRPGQAFNIKLSTFNIQPRLRETLCRARPEFTKRFVGAGLQPSTFNFQLSTFNFQHHPSTFTPKLSPSTENCSFQSSESSTVFPSLCSSDISK